MAVSKRCPADHNGPLIPHPSFAEAFAAGTLAGDDLDKAIVRLIELQQDSWVSVVTDGELRRTAMLFDPVAEARFLAANTDLCIKVRAPHAGARGIADPCQIENLLKAGANYVQFDGSAYAPLIGKQSRAALKANGTDPDAEIARLLALDAAVFKGTPRSEDVKFAVAFHDVTDLSTKGFAHDIDLDAAASVLEGLPVSRFIIDCGPEETPDFSFLSIMPEDAMVVLGLVDGNAAKAPDAKSVFEKIDAASRVLDTDRFALSTRHGFYRRPDEDAQAAWDRQAKMLTLLLDASSRAWGIDF